MRFNFLRNKRLPFKLLGLVAMSFLIAVGLIDNRMVSGQSIHGVAHALTKSSVDWARDDWDTYFLGDMIDKEQALAYETTPTLDAVYGRVQRPLKKLIALQLTAAPCWRWFWPWS